MGTPVGGVIPFEQRVYVKRWNGTQWALLGDKLNSGDNDSVGWLHLALDGSGNPGMLTKDWVGSLYVAKWTGSAWSGFSGIASIFGPGVPSSATLAFRSGGVPVVAYQYTPGPGPKVAVVTHTGGSWGSLIPGVPIDPAGNAMAPRIVIDRGDDAVVVATATGSNGGLLVRKAVGSQWKALGGQLDGPLLFSADPADIAFDPSGKLFAVFAQRQAAGDSQDIVVVEWPLP